MKPPPPAPDVLRHLADSLETQWRRYRKRLKRCQRKFSEGAVHDSRVETRRLLASIELLNAFIPEPDVKKARRTLKAHLDSFDQLRDTQVQLRCVAHLLATFPAAKAFNAWLHQREARFIRESRKAVKKIRTRRLGKRVTGFQQELARLGKITKPEPAFRMAQRAIRLAFARVARLCRQVDAADTKTIHRTRIAFKRFRYMVDALAPLLPAITDQARQAMRGYQCMMGDIQDVEVLLATLGKFIADGHRDRATHRLRAEFERRRDQLIRVYLNAAGKLQQFWPLPPASSILPRTGTDGIA